MCHFHAPAQCPAARPAVCSCAGLSEPETLADEFLLLIEGARVTAQSVGADGLGVRLVRMSEALIAAHGAKAAQVS